MPNGKDSLDAYKAGDIAARVEAAGVAKAQLAAPQLMMLATLAGVFIAFGGAFYLAVIAGDAPPSGALRLAGGVAFSLGLILVVVGGAELFTGNALMVMAWVDGLIGLHALLRNWVLVYLGNGIGALGAVLLFLMAGFDAGAVADMAKRVAEAKLALGPMEAFARGVLCNALVCLAVWLSFSAHGAGEKTLVVIPPIAAFVTLGLEHSVANMFLLPLGIAAGAAAEVGAVFGNLALVTLGNIVGGAGGVAIAYRIAYGPKETR